MKKVYRIIGEEVDPGCIIPRTWTRSTLYLSKEKAERTAKELNEKFNTGRNEDGDRIYYSYYVDELLLDDEES